MSDWKFPDFPLGNIPPHVQQLSSSSLRFGIYATSSAPVSALSGPNRPDNSPGHNFDNGQVEQGQECDSDHDPRNEVRPPRRRKEKTSANNLLHSMVREFLIQEGLYIPTKSLATGAAPPSSANPSTVAAFMDRVGRGPSQEHPLFSWEHSVSHAWNVAVIRVLNQKFRTYVTEKGLPKLLRLLGPNMSTSIAASDINRALDGAGDIEILIQEKLEYQQGLLRRTQRRVHALQGHMASEVEDNLKYELKTSRTKARRQERKRNLYLRRAAIIEEQLRRQDPELWEQINLVFAHFNEDGMSSDETEVEKGFGAPKLLRRVRKLWVSPDITKIFHYIDNHYNPTTVTGTLKKGSAPLKREIGSHKCNALAPPKPNLPVNFYSTDMGEDRMMSLEPKPAVNLPMISIQMDIDT